MIIVLKCPLFLKFLGNIILHCSVLRVCAQVGGTLKYGIMRRILEQRHGTRKRQGFDILLWLSDVIAQDVRRVLCFDFERHPYPGHPAHWYSDQRGFSRMKFRASIISLVTPFLPLLDTLAGIVTVPRNLILRQSTNQPRDTFLLCTTSFNDSNQSITLFIITCIESIS